MLLSVYNRMRCLWDDLLYNRLNSFILSELSKSDGKITNYPSGLITPFYITRHTQMSPSGVYLTITTGNYVNDRYSAVSRVFV